MISTLMGLLQIAAYTGTFLRVLEGLYEPSAKVIDIIMKIAPCAVACLPFNNTALFGVDLLGALAWFILRIRGCSQVLGLITSATEAWPVQ